jgi:phosphoribosylglycinamide formyltransferase 1
MIKIGFMASHGGSGMKAVLNAMQKGLNAMPTVLICNNKNAVAFNIAKQYDMTCYHLSSKTHADAELLDSVICATLKKHDIDILMLSGYMKKLGPLTLSEFQNRILNIHPSLLPKFGGQGMYGDRVHQAVIDNNEKISGASVHIVTADYDQGPVLNQIEVTVENGETVASLRDKIKQLEGGLYVKTLERIISGDIKMTLSR